jgi:hypothetical protein
MKTQGLFNNFTREGVSSNLDHRSTNGRLISSQAKEREARPPSPAPASGRHGRPPWLAGELRLPRLGRPQRFEDGTRLGMAVAPLPACESFENT